MLPCSMQGFLYSFFLIPEFLLWASCPWPNHCCLTQVSHGEQKLKTHYSLSPSSSEASFPWPAWPTCTYIDSTGTAITLPCGLWLNICYSGGVCGKTVPGKKCLVEIQKRKRDFMNIIPSTCFKLLLLLTCIYDTMNSALAYMHQRA